MGYVDNLYVVAAICGNFTWESTVNPGVWEGLTPDSPGYGLGQWTDNPSIGLYRRTNLFDYLESHNYSQDSGIGQMKFLIYENSWVPNGAGYPSLYPTLGDFLKSESTDLRELTFEFFHHWEGIDDGTGDSRYLFAQTIYNHISTYKGKRNPWYKGNFYLNEEQYLSNCVLIMDFLTKDETDKKRMALWLMYYLTKN